MEQNLFENRATGELNGTARGSSVQRLAQMSFDVRHDVGRPLEREIGARILRQRMDARRQGLAGRLSGHVTLSSTMLPTKAKTQRGIISFQRACYRGLMSTIEHRLSERGIVLPQASDPAANYANSVESSGLLFVSGKGPRPAPGAKPPRGKLGREFTTQQGYEFARATGLDILAVVKLAVGSLEHVRRVVKVQGFINATEDYDEHPQVLNGCSDLMVEVFGDNGLHARSVLGAFSLRGGLPLIIESVFEVAPR